jgi:monomeric sarcosine oxidase
MTTTRADLIVVGAGLAGSAAAWAAATRGMDVVVLEAFAPGHRNGSSHGSARIFRRAYLDPLYVQLTGQARTAWRHLESEAGEPLLRQTGGLDYGPARDAAAMHALLTKHGVPAELLTEAAAAERWPQFDFTTAGPVMFHAEAGVLDPDRGMAAMLRLASARGADIHVNTPVTRLTASGDGAEAHTDSGTWSAPVIVIAAGAWLPELLGDLIKLPPLTVTQQQIYHFAPRQAPKEPWPAFIYADNTATFYGLLGGRDGGIPGAIKLGEHDLGPVTTPKTRDFTINPEQRDRFLSWALPRLPGLETTPINETTCLYTSTATEDFILDRRGPFVVASPCSGHGAKFAPLLGEIITALAAGEPPPDERFKLTAHLTTEPR